MERVHTKGWRNIELMRSDHMQSGVVLFQRMKRNTKTYSVQTQSDLADRSWYTMRRLRRLHIKRFHEAICCLEEEEDPSMNQSFQFSQDLFVDL